LAFFGFLAYFGLLLLGTLSTDFRFFDGVRQQHVPSNDAENFRKIKFDNSEQCGSKVGDGALLVHFWGLPPFGVRIPHLTHVSYSSGDREKNGFCLGGIGPHLGEIWEFEIWHFSFFWRTLAYFFSELCRQIFDFLTAFDSRTYPLTMLKI